MPSHPCASRALAAALTLSLFTVPLAARATNGYFSDGYGAKSEGEGGVGIAFAQDALAAASNPAGTGLVGDRLDLGLDGFFPSRGVQFVGNAYGPNADYSGDGRHVFLIPNLGYTHQLSPELGAGIALYGNGGLNTDYSTNNPYARFGAQGAAGVNLEQLFVTPSLAWKPAPGQSLGLGLNLAYQRFSAQGIGVFGAFSSAPQHVSDQGTDSSLGAGVRLGWTGTLAPGLTAGASWASRVRGSFSDYRGLFADGGRFDVPDNYGAGLSFAPDERWQFAFDLQRIDYAHVAAVGDPLAPLLSGVPLGAGNGPGFGWRNIDVYKFGASYKASGQLTLRLGYDHADQAVPQTQTFFNILAPGVVQEHYTLGATWAPGGAGAWSAFFAFAPTQTVYGAGSIPASFGGGQADVHLRETIVGISYGWKL